jgi:hypothetical protein
MENSTNCTFFTIQEEEEATYLDLWRKFMFLSNPDMKAGTRAGGFQALLYITCHPVSYS